jgi:microcystin-dependent protein
MGSTESAHRRGVARCLASCLILPAVWIVLSASSLYGQEGDDALIIDEGGNVTVGKKLKAEKLEGDGSAITVKAVEGDKPLRIPEALGMLVPIGTIMAYGGDVTDPDIKKSLKARGWLHCDGSTKKINGDYKDLYRVIGDAFGRDGNNFYLPDMRGQFLRGVDHGKGRDPDAGERTHPVSGEKVGDKVGSVQEDRFKRHNHPVNDPGHGHQIDKGHLHHNHGTYDKSYAVPRSINNFEGKKNLDSSKTNIKVDQSGDKETRPKNIYVNWIIKARHMIR